MSETSETPTTESDRRVKVGHLVTGLVFVGLSVTWLLRADGTLGDLEIALVVPVLLVAAGVVGLVALVVGNARRSSELRAAYPDPTGDHPADDPTDDPTDTRIQIDDQEEHR